MTDLDAATLRVVREQGEHAATVGLSLHYLLGVLDAWLREPQAEAPPGHAAEVATLRAARLTEQVREWRAEAEAAGDRARAECALRREVEAERDASLATATEAAGTVARLTAERDRMQYRTRCILNADSPSYPLELDEYRQCGCRICAMYYEREIRAQAWAEAVQVVEQTIKDYLATAHPLTHAVVIDLKIVVLDALRARAEREP